MCIKEETGGRLQLVNECERRILTWATYVDAAAVLICVRGMWKYYHVELGYTRFFRTCTAWIMDGCNEMYGPGKHACDPGVACQYTYYHERGRGPRQAPAGHWRSKLSHACLRRGGLTCTVETSPHHHQISCWDLPAFGMACEAPYHHLQLPHTTNYSLACLCRVKQRHMRWQSTPTVWKGWRRNEGMPRVGRVNPPLYIRGLLRCTILSGASMVSSGAL